VTVVALVDSPAVARPAAADDEGSVRSHPSPRSFDLPGTCAYLEAAYAHLPGKSDDHGAALPHGGSERPQPLSGRDGQGRCHWPAPSATCAYQDRDLRAYQDVPDQVLAHLRAALPATRPQDRDKSSILVVEDNSGKPATSRRGWGV
jgi:hypothetical protein